MVATDDIQSRKYIIARGSLRQVYGYSRDLVIKIPKKSRMHKGELKNRLEFSIYESEVLFKDFIASVHSCEATLGVLSLLVERAFPLTNLSMNLFDYLKNEGLTVPFNRMDIEDFANRHNLILEELLLARHWGYTRNGVLKLLDFGTTYNNRPNIWKIKSQL